MNDAGLSVLAISVGNTRTSFAVFQNREVASVESRGAADLDALAAAILEASKELAGAERAAVVVSSVCPEVSADLIRKLRPGLEHELYQIGSDIPAPVERAIDPEANTGQDRLLAAAAAFDMLGEACVVVDAGTAITIDFVDGAGVFQGGAIAPGAGMMLRSLHEGAAQLPRLEPAMPPGAEPFGKNTEEAMLNGVIFGMRGAVRMLTERYAERYGAYPRVIATGGDAHLLFDDDELIDAVVDDLVLKGVALACERALLGAPTDQ